MSIWEKQKVLLVTSSYPFFLGDYHALFIQEMAMELVKLGAQVSVLTPGTLEGGAEVTQSKNLAIHRFSYVGYQSSRFSLTGRDGILENIKRSPWSLCTLMGFLSTFFISMVRQIQRDRPTLIIAHWLLPSGLLTAILSLGYPKIRILHYAHSSDVHLISYLPGRKWILQGMAQSGRILVPSEFLKTKILSLSPKIEVSVIPLGVHCPNIVAKKQVDIHSLRLCYMGRLTPSKGLARLIETVCLIPGATLTIAGSGKDQPVLQQLIQEKKAKVSIVSPVLGEQKSTFLQAHDLFLFLPNSPTKQVFQDNLPISILEAMAHGVPIIASPVGALKYLLAEGKGGLLIDGNHTLIAERIVQLTTVRILEMSQEAQSIAKKYSWIKCLELITNFLPQ